MKMLDGNALRASEHQLKELRRLSSGPLPGKALVVYEPVLDLMKRLAKSSSLEFSKVWVGAFECLGNFSKCSVSFFAAPSQALPRARLGQRNRTGSPSRAADGQRPALGQSRRP